MSSHHRVLAVAALALTLAVPAAAFAQTAPAPPAPGSQVQPLGPGAYGNGHHGKHRRHGHRHGMFSKLNLSAAQKQQIATIHQQARQQNQNVTDPAARRANGQRVRQQVEAVLTPSQRTQLQQQRQQWRSHRHDGSNGPLPAPTPAH